MHTKGLLWLVAAPLIALLLIISSLLGIMEMAHGLNFPEAVCGVGKI